MIISNSIFEEIDFCKRFKCLSTCFRPDSYLEVTQKEKVLNLFEELGHDAKYNSKGQFYRISQSVEGYNITLNISLKYGVCELTYGVTDRDRTDVIGGPATAICKRFEILDGIKSNEYVRNPAFSNYEELEQILKVGLDLFMDLAKVITSKLQRNV